MTDRLLHWAQTTPEHSFIAQRERLADGRTGDWQHISYAQALAAARSIGQALVERGLSAERPVVILSENDLDHAMLAMGCLYAGVPYCSVSAPYSLVSTDYAKLRHVVDTLTPGLIFASDAARYDKAVRAVLPTVLPAVLPAGCEVVYRNSTAGLRRIPSLPTCWQHRPRPPWTRPCGPRDRTRSPSFCSPRARPSCPRP